MDLNKEEISSKYAREHMSDILNHVAYTKKQYTLTRHGKGVAVMISLEQWNAIERLLEQLEDEEDIRDAEIALNRTKSEGTTSHKALKRSLGLG